MSRSDGDVGFIHIQLSLRNARKRQSFAIQKSTFLSALKYRCKLLRPACVQSFSLDTLLGNVEVSYWRRIVFFTFVVKVVVFYRLHSIT